MVKVKMIIVQVLNNLLMSYLRIIIYLFILYFQKLMIKKKIKMQYNEKGKLYIDNCNVIIGNNSIENISNKDNDVLYD